MTASRLLTAPLLAASLVFGGCLSLPGASTQAISPGAASLDGGVIAQSAFAREVPQGAQARAAEAEYQALQFGSAGEVVTWSASGYSGRVVPTQVYRVGSQDCRGYTQFIEGSQPARLSGTACRSDDGRWVLV